MDPNGDKIVMLEIILHFRKREKLELNTWAKMRNYFYSHWRVAPYSHIIRKTVKLYLPPGYTFKDKEDAYRWRKLYLRRKINRLWSEYDGERYGK